MCPALLVVCPDVRRQTDPQPRPDKIDRTLINTLPTLPLKRGLILLARGGAGDVYLGFDLNRKF
jgi:hypothetical protein